MPKISKPGIIIVFAITGLALFGLVEKVEAADETAASCSAVDIQTAVNMVLGSGDADNTVNIPACNIVWTVGEKVNVSTGLSKKIRLIGSGQSTTKIKYFQIGVPSDTLVSHIVEWAHMTVWSDGVTNLPPISARLRSDPPGQELYWHDITIDSYKTNYVLHLEGWRGVITRFTMIGVDIPSGQNNYGIGIHGDGVYSAHRNDLGTRNALFIEDSSFSYYSHTISLFCDAFAVFRHNTVNYADAYIDIHGPGYNFCKYGPTQPNDKHGGGGYEVYGNTFNNYQGSWLVSPRAGSAGIIVNNRVGIPGNETFFVAVRADSGVCNNSVNCGSGAGQTCSRKYLIDSSNGCTQAKENWYIWNNTGAPSGEIYLYGETTCASQCVRADIDYFNRAPTLVADGFTWMPFTYPHPLTLGDGGDTTPPSAPTGLTVE